MFLTLITVLISFASAEGWQAQHEGLWDTHTKRWIELRELARESRPGEIFIFGEEHATFSNAHLPSTFTHHDNQMRLIHRLQESGAARGFSVSVGMEFLTYTLQNFVDQFVNGEVSEVSFLKSVQWGGNPFAFYRRQIRAPRFSGGQTVALNIPQAIASKVAMQGPASLDAQDQLLLPPVWEKGSAGYYARFAQAMKGHVTDAQLENFFWAQSLWDDTMAWRALEHRAQHPNDVMVIIVGAFHVEFGGGLPYEIYKLGHAPVKTVLQIEAAEWNDSTLQAILQPDADFGLRADYLWVHSGSKAL